MIDLSPLRQAFQGKSVAILGLGKSGMPVFEACRAAGIATLLWDDNAEARKAAEAKGGRVEDLSAADFRGVACLCMSPGIPLTHPAPHPAAARAKAAHVEILGDIELFRRARPAHRTIGVTGTNGKSTTTALLGHILKEAKIPSAIGGNIGEAILTLPELPPEGVYVLEMSSYQIDLCPTFTPGIACLVNLSPDHLDRHGGMDGYVATKEKMFRGAGTAVLGIDDEWSQAVAERLRGTGGRKLVAVSCERPLMHGVYASREGALFDGKDKILDLNTCPALPGRHNWQNAGIAYAAARAAGVPVPAIVKAMHTFPGLAHRQNFVGSLRGVSYVNDSKATNDDAAAVALRTYDPIYWIAGGKPKEGGYAQCEKYLSHVRHAFLIGQAEADLAAWLAARNTAFTRCGTLETAVAAAHELAQREQLGQAVVLLSPACASFDQFRSFEHRGEVFTALVRKMIPAAGPLPAVEKRGKA